MRSIVIFSVALIVSVQFALCSFADEKPNIIVIFTDDQGYNDLGCFGSKTIRTPYIDRMAEEGRKYTSFYVASPICSPSRAALLTGCYPKRVGMHKGVLFPQSKHGLHPDEYTIADHLKSAGYATGCFGKWHLGDHPETLPRAQGFDTYFGIPYSNDMNHPDNSSRPEDIPSDELWADQSSAVNKWNTPLMENEEVIEVPADQRTITRRYTDRAIDFMKTNRERPFFVYLAHSMPHIPLYVPEDAYDADPKNAYKCVIEHIDYEVGRLLRTVRALKLKEKTWVIFTSDNGPWLKYKNHAGSAEPLRDGKATNFEGGQRVPCIMWAPGRIEPGTSTDAFTTTMDLLPTVAAMTKTELPDRKIDGYDISSTFSGNWSPRSEMIYYSKDGKPEGFRSKRWKFLETSVRDKSGKNQVKTFLFDLSRDIGEQNNMAAVSYVIADELRAEMIAADKEITANARPPWRKQASVPSGK